MRAVQTVVVFLVCVVIQGCDDGYLSNVAATDAEIDSVDTYPFERASLGVADALLDDVWVRGLGQMDIRDGDKLLVGDGVHIGSLVFDSSWTVGHFASAIETQIRTLGLEIDVVVAVDGNRIRFTNPTGGNSSDVTLLLVSLGRPVFNSLVSDLSLADGTTARSLRSLHKRDAAHAEL